MISELYAHGLPNRPKDEWQPLDKHLQAMTEMAKEFDLSFVENIWIESAQVRDYAV